MAQSIRSVAKLTKNLRRNVLGTSRHLSTKPSYEELVHNAPDTRVTVLKNGLRVISEDYGNPSATVGVFINAGSRFETGKTNGAGNFLEHVVFKGTKKRTQAALESEIEKLGASLNAHTGREQAAYYGRVASKDVPKMVDILGDILQNSTISDEIVEKERAVILRELDEANHNLPLIVDDMLHQTAYQGTPLARSVLGPSENIKSMTAQNLRDYIHLFHLAPRMALVAAGGVDHDSLVAAAEQHFGSIKSSHNLEIPVVAPCRFSGAQMDVRDDDIGLAHISICVEGVGMGDDDAIPLLVAMKLIGSWDRSLVAGGNVGSSLAHWSAKENLCHSFKSFNYSYGNTGLWGIKYITDRMQIDNFSMQMHHEWNMLCTSATEGEVTRAKNALRASFLQKQNNSTSIVADIGSQLLAYGKRVPFSEIEHRIDAVTAKVVQKVCEKHLYDKCPAIAAIGPIEQLPDYNRSRGRMWWLRT